MESCKRSLPSLREEIALGKGSAREFIACLFDEGTFLETGTYIKNGENYFEGVVTGCGAVDGRLVFAFVQDYSNGKGAFTSAHSDKICELYGKAIKAKAPVVALYSGAGAKLGEGIDVLSGYGAVLAKMNLAKAVIPQIAVISGACGGASAVCAQSADIIISDKDNGKRYVFTGSKHLSADLYASGKAALADTVRKTLNMLPSNSEEGTVCSLPDEEISTPDEKIRISAEANDSDALISSLCDRGAFLELSGEEAKEMITALGEINGKVVGIVANRASEQGGALTCQASYKAARFIDMLGRFNIPLLTLVNTTGFGGKDCGRYADALASLTSAYVNCRSAKVSAVVGRAYGSAFAIMGSKKLGADFVFALDSADISVMAPESAVEFVWEDRVKSASDPDKAREELVAEWRDEVSSPIMASRSGDIDDIVEYSELRARIAAAFEVLL